MFLFFSSVPSNCEYVDQPGTYLPFTDTYISSVTDIEECRSQCSAQGQYNCRSFNFNAFRKECFLSSDDSVALPTGLQTDRDFTFSERAGCNSGMQTTITTTTTTTTINTCISSTPNNNNNIFRYFPLTTQT